LSLIRWVAVGPLLIVAWLGCISIVGCGDDSRTSGTQLQMSPEAKAEIEDMRSIMQQEKAERTKSRTAAKKKK